MRFFIKLWAGRAQSLGMTRKGGLVLENNYLLNVGNRGAAKSCTYALYAYIKYGCRQHTNVTFQNCAPGAQTASLVKPGAEIIHLEECRIWLIFHERSARSERLTGESHSSARLISGAMEAVLTDYLSYDIWVPEPNRLRYQPRSRSFHPFENPEFRSKLWSSGTFVRFGLSHVVAYKGLTKSIKCGNASDHGGPMCQFSSSQTAISNSGLTDI